MSVANGLFKLIWLFVIRILQYTEFLFEGSQVLQIL